MKFQGVFDLETHHWTNFVMGGTFDGVEYRHFDDEATMVQWLLTQEGVWFAHNGGFFDALWFIQRITELGIAYQVSLVGSRVHSLRIGKLVIRDSMSIIPFSLQKAGMIVNDSKDELTVPFSKFDDLTEDEHKEVSRYMRQDCILLYRVLERLSNFCIAHSIDLRQTIGATAIATAMGEVDYCPEKWARGNWLYARKGYYGGRTEVFQIQVNYGHRFDINSSYTNALVNTELPIGNSFLCNSKQADLMYLGGVEGVYECTVEVPEMLFGPLPHRGYGRIWFPTGTFTGHWTGLELREAELMGATIIDFKSALVWQETDAVLKPWCDRIFQLRIDFGVTNKGWNMWLKWLLNSLTGKLAQRDEMSTLRHSTDGQPVPCNGHKFPHEGECPSNKCCPHRCVGTCNQWESLNETGDLWKKTFHRIPPHAKPHWAAYLTASARIQLLRALVEAGENAIYCDTDSVYRVGMGNLDVGLNLGQWTYEGEAHKWECLAPKVDRFRANNGDETVKGRDYQP